MKELVIIAAAAAAMALLFASCHRSGGEEVSEVAAAPLTEAAADSVTRSKSWSKTAPEDLELKPIERIAKDWMALSMGTAKSFNSMTISWGTIGQLWNKPVMIVFVSSDRASKKLMDGYNFFTVCGFPDSKACRQGLEYLGSHSLKDEPDKVKNSGLTVEFTELGNPVFQEANLAIECRKIYSEEFSRERLPQDVKERLYSNMGLHTMYIGEIVNVYEKH